MAHAARRFAALGTLLGRGEWRYGLAAAPSEAVASIEASVAPVWRHRFEAHRAAFEHGLQSVDAAIALSQTLRSAEAVGRAVAHAELFEAEPAAWRVVDEPELFALLARTSGRRNRTTSRRSGTLYGRRRRAFVCHRR